MIFKNHLLHSAYTSILQITHAYTSMLITYDSFLKDLKSEVTKLKSDYKSRQAFDLKKPILWKVPVCYDPVFGLDLEEMSKEKHLGISEIVRLHSEAIYKVYFIGFLPGFLYLGGLDHRLHVPRKNTPRQRIAKGAVAIGGEQTGIYPNASPGGWNLIGNSPLPFFNPTVESPCFASAGDGIQFVPIDYKKHQDISKAVQNGAYHIESEVLDG